MLTKKYLKTNGKAKVTFSIPTEALNGSTHVHVVGDWNNWEATQNQVLKVGKKDAKVTLDLETGRNYQFRYYLGDNEWENDWAADGYIPSHIDGVDNSVLELPAQNGQSTGTKLGATNTKEVKANTKATSKDNLTNTASAPRAKAAAKKADKPTVNKTSRKRTSKAKLEEGTDDLKRIEGIGPKIAGLFNDAGILTFKDLAKAKKTHLKEILLASGPRFRMADPTTWQEQAKLAAKGKWDELDVLQKELKGGKRK